LPVKSDEQLDLQSLHRVRERWVMRRTAVVNQIRGVLLERGILADPAPKLSCTVQVLLAELKLELAQLAEKIDRADKSMEKIAQENEACQRLVTMPGVGPVISTAIIATIGNGAAFRRGRDFAVWLGGSPGGALHRRQAGTVADPSAGQSVPAHVVRAGSQIGDAAQNKTGTGLSAWLAQLTARTHRNVAIVALANKLARIAWAVLTKNEVYRPRS
jgi:transposase